MGKSHASQYANFEVYYTYFGTLFIADLNSS